MFPSDEFSYILEITRQYFSDVRTGTRFQKSERGRAYLTDLIALWNEQNLDELFKEGTKEEQDFRNSMRRGNHVEWLSQFGAVRGNMDCDTLCSIKKDHIFRYEDDYDSYRLPEIASKLLKRTNGSEKTPIDWFPFEEDSLYSAFYHGTNSISLSSMLECGEILCTNELLARGMEIETGEFRGLNPGHISVERSYGNGLLWAEKFSGKSIAGYPMILGIRKTALKKRSKYGTMDGEICIPKSIDFKHVSHVYVPLSRVEETKELLSYSGYAPRVIGFEEVNRPPTIIQSRIDGLLDHYRMGQYPENFGKGEFYTSDEYSGIVRLDGTAGRISYDQYGKAGAGVMIVDPSGEKILLLERNPKCAGGLQWSIPGGARNDVVYGLEDAIVAAVCEMDEEIGCMPEGIIHKKPHVGTYANGFEYSTFLMQANNDFKIKLNNEHKKAAWVPIAALSDYPYLHPGVLEAANYFFHS